MYYLLNVVEKNGPLGLIFTQIVDLTTPRRSVGCGFIGVSHLVSSFVEMKLALSQEEKSQSIFQGGNNGKGRRQRAVEDEVARVTGFPGASGAPRTC